MRRAFLLALLAVCALPAAAFAAPVKIGPTATGVTVSGVSTFEAANPNAYVVRGTAKIAAGRRTVASRSVRLGKRSVTTVRMTLTRPAVDFVRAAGGRVRITLKVRRAGSRRAMTARRTVTLSLPGSGGPAAPSPSQSQSQSNGAAAPGPAAQAGPSRWVGRMGSDGAYDDLELTIDNGQMTITKAPLVPVVCGENGGAYRSSVSLEIFDAPGPWAIGTDGMVSKSGISPNVLVNSGSKTINYKVEQTVQEAGKVTGKLGMSFSDSKLDILNGYKITFINCFGSQSFEAIPA